MALSHLPVIDGGVFSRIWSALHRTNYVRFSVSPLRWPRVGTMVFRIVSTPVVMKNNTRHLAVSMLNYMCGPDSNLVSFPHTSGKTLFSKVNYNKNENLFKRVFNGGKAGLVSLSRSGWTLSQTDKVRSPNGWFSLILSTLRLWDDKTSVASLVSLEGSTPAL